MLNYISEVLNINCSQIDIPLDKIILPLYLDLYEIQPISLDGVKVLFITPRETLSNVKALKKHLEKMQSLSGCFVSLLLNDISETRKKSFLENHIPFVVTNNQIYLPFMAIYLQEKNKTIIEAVSQLTPAAQLVFINFFKQNSEALAVASFAKKLQFSEMSTTRALRQLVATGLFEIKKGTITNSNLLVTKVKNKEELFNKIEPYLINPVKNSFYIDKEEIKTTAPAQTAAPAAPAAPAQAGGTTVSAPMPGTILKVNVANGQAVKKGDVLMVLEAMKMENDIVAPCDGTIKQLLVSKGSTVNTDDVLAVL